MARAKSAAKSQVANLKRKGLSPASQGLTEESEPLPEAAVIDLSAEDADEDADSVLAKADDARMNFGAVLDTLSKAEVYLLSFTYQMMATTTVGKYIPKVPLELLNHVYYSMVNQGPCYPTTFGGDQVSGNQNVRNVEKSCTPHVMTCTHVSL